MLAFLPLQLSLSDVRALWPSPPPRSADVLGQRLLPPPHLVDVRQLRLLPPSPLDARLASSPPPLLLLGARLVPSPRPLPSLGVRPVSSPPPLLPLDVWLVLPAFSPTPPFLVPPRTSAPTWILAVCLAALLCVVVATGAGPVVTPLPCPSSCLRRAVVNYSNITSLLLILILLLASTTAAPYDDVLFQGKTGGVSRDSLNTCHLSLLSLVAIAGGAGLYLTHLLSSQEGLAYLMARWLVLIQAAPDGALRLYTHGFTRLMPLCFPLGRLLGHYVSVVEAATATSGGYRGVSLPADGKRRPKPYTARLGGAQGHLIDQFSSASARPPLRMHLLSLSVGRMAP